MDDLHAQLSHSILLQWDPFAIAFNSPFSIETRLAVCSFIKNNSNLIKTFRFVGPSVIEECSIEVGYPQLQCQFSPTGSQTNSDFFITCSDSVKLFIAGSNSIEQIADIVVTPSDELVTGIDWSITDENTAICCCTDCTVNLIDLNAGTKVSGFIAHDHQIHDIKYCGASPTFITAGFDGSMRFFDLRDLSASYIYYQTAMPLQRVAISSHDPNQIACISQGGRAIEIIDARQTGMASAVVKCSSAVTSVCWSRMVESRVFGTNADGELFAGMTNAGSVESPVQVIHRTSAPRNGCVIGAVGVAAATHNKIEIFRQIQITKRVLHYPMEMLLGG